MGYVILQPHSLTNPSDNYRVVEADEWTGHSQGREATYAVRGEFSTYPEAEKHRDQLNSSETDR